MHVLHVTEIVKGGLVTYLDALLPAQAEQAELARVSLLAPRQHMQQLVQTKRAQVAMHGYDRRGRDVFSLWRLLRAYRQIVKTEKPDLIHVHCAFAGLVCRLLVPTIPVIYCPHGWSHDREGGGLGLRLFAAIERFLASRCAAIVAISEYERSSGLRIGIPEIRLRVIHCGVDAPRGEVEPPARREQGGPLRLLFLGRFDRQKGLDWLLEVVSGLAGDEVQLVVAGAAVTDGDCVPEQLPANTTLLGWLSQEEVDAHIATSDAVIVPSRWEGFGLVVIEAMRLGVPALVSDRGALPEVVGHEEGGLVFPFGDTHSLRSLLRTLQREQLSMLGKTGLQRYQRHFTLQRMREDVLGLYQEVIAGSRPNVN